MHRRLDEVQIRKSFGSKTMGSELWQRLRAARKAADMSQQQLAETLGVTRSAVSIWEADTPGVRRVPTMKHAKHIADVLKVPLHWLMDDQSAPADAYRMSMGVPNEARPPATIAVPSAELYRIAVSPEELLTMIKGAAPGTHIVFVTKQVTLSSADSADSALQQIVDLARQSRK